MSVELLNNLPPEIQAFIEGHPERAQIEAAFNDPAENIRNISRLMQGAETEQEEQILRLIGITLNTDSNFAELVADENWRRLQDDVERKAEYIRENAAYSFDEASPESLSGNDAALFAMERFAADYIDAKRIEAIGLVPAEELTETAIAFRDQYNATRLSETMAAQGDIDTTIATLAEEGDFAQIYAIANTELTKIAEFGGESEDALNRAAELTAVAETAATINMIGLENYQNLAMLQEAGDYAGIAALTGQILADNADNAAIQQNFGPLHTQSQILAAIGVENYAELERLGQEENFAGLAQLAESLIAENADNAAVTENIGLVLADANARIRAAEVAEGNYSADIEDLLANGSTDELLAATLYHAHHSSQAAYALRAVGEDGQVTIQNGTEYLAEAQLYDGLSDRLFETAYNARAEEIIEKYGLYGEPANAIRNNHPGAFQDSYRPYGLSDEAVAEARELFTMNTIRDLQGDIKYSVNNRSTTLLERRLERLEAGEYELNEEQTQAAIEQVRAAIEFVEQSPEKELLQETMATVANIEHLRTMEVFFNDTVADYGYDGDIFTSADMMSEADMANTESFQKASAILFEREYGMTWEEADARDGTVDGVVNTNDIGAGWEYGEVTLGEWGIKFMSEEENQLWEVLQKGFDFYIADGYSQEEQIALLYAAEAFHRTENSSESFWRAVGYTVTDEANLVSIPAMIASFGASSAAVEAGKQTARIGLVKAISRAVVLDLGRIEGVQGALDGGLRADLDQRLRIRTGFMGEENYSVMSTVTGAAVGGAAELALGRTIQIGAGLAGRFVSDTVVPGVRRAADILPPLRRVDVAPEVRADAPATLVEPEIASDAAPELAPAADAPVRADTVEPELAEPAAPEIAPEAVPALETPAVDTTIDAEIVAPEVAPNSIDALRIPAAEAADPALAANSPAPLAEPVAPAEPNVVQFTPPSTPIAAMPSAPRFGALDLANPNRGLAAAPGPIDGYTPRPNRPELETPSARDEAPAGETPADLQARQRAEQAARQEQQPRAAQEWQPMQQQQQQARAGGTPDVTPSYRMPPRWKQADAEELARAINSESDAGRISYMLGKIDAERGEIFSDVFSAMRTSKQEAFIMNIYNNDPAAARAIMIDLPETIQTRLNTAIEGARRLEENLGSAATPPPRPAEPTPAPRATEEPRVEATDEPAARPADEPRVEGAEAADKPKTPKDYSDVEVTLRDRIGSVFNWFRSPEEIKKIKIDNLREADAAAARAAEAVRGAGDRPPAGKDGLFSGTPEAIKEDPFAEATTPEGIAKFIKDQREIYSNLATTQQRVDFLTNLISDKILSVPVTARAELWASMIHDKASPLYAIRSIAQNGGRDMNNEGRAVLRKVYDNFGGNAADGVLSHGRRFAPSQTGGEAALKGAEIGNIARIYDDMTGRQGLKTELKPLTLNPIYRFIDDLPFTTEAARKKDAASGTNSEISKIAENFTKKLDYFIKNGGSAEEVAKMVIMGRIYGLRNQLTSETIFTPTRNNVINSNPQLQRMYNEIVKPITDYAGDDGIDTISPRVGWTFSHYFPRLFSQGKEVVVSGDILNPIKWWKGTGRTPDFDNTMHNIVGGIVKPWKWPATIYDTFSANLRKYSVSVGAEVPAAGFALKWIAAPILFATSTIIVEEAIVEPIIGQDAEIFGVDLDVGSRFLSDIPNAAMFIGGNIVGAVHPDVDMGFHHFDSAIGRAAASLGDRDEPSLDDPQQDDRPATQPAIGFTTGAVAPDAVTPPAGAGDETDVADAADAPDAADADPAGTTGEETEVAAADDAPETPGNGGDDAPETPVTDEQRRAAERNRILAARRRETGEGYSTEEVIQAVLPGAAGEALTSATSRIELGKVWNTAKGWFGDLGLMAGNLWTAMGQMPGPWGGIAQIGTAIVGAMMGKNLLTGAWNLFTTGANWKNMAIIGGLGIGAYHALNYFSGQAETTDRVLTNSDYRSAYAGLGTESIQNYGGRGAAYDTTTGDVQLDSHYVAPTTGETMTAQLGQDPAATATLAAAQDAMRAQMDPATLARIQFTEAANGIDTTRQVAALDVTLGDIAVTDDMRVTGHDGVPYTLASVTSFDLETGVPTQTWSSLGELAKAGEELAAEENFGYVGSQQGLGVQNAAMFVGSTYAVAALDEDEKATESRYLPTALRGSNDIVFDVTPHLAALDTAGWREETAKGTGSITPDAPAQEGPVSFASLAAEPENVPV